MHLVPGTGTLIICASIRIIRVIEVHNQDAFAMVITNNVHEVFLKTDDMFIFFGGVDAYGIFPRDVYDILNIQYDNIYGILRKLLYTRRINRYSEVSLRMTYALNDYRYTNKYHVGTSSSHNSVCRKEISNKSQ